MFIEPVAVFRSPFETKFGVPRQAGVVPELKGRIVFEPKFRNPDAVRGLEGFDYIWLVWGFSAVPEDGDHFQATVRPPRLGGDTRIGVFASRSPFRPNRLGLSSVRIESIEYDCPDGPVINVLGADLMDGTPVYDVKPYVTYTDSHPEAAAGFVDENGWKPLEVVFEAYVPDGIDAEALRGVLAQDPRPRSQNDPERIYGMTFAGSDVRFKVSGGVLTVVSFARLCP